jgi:hypothetical protein
VVLRTDTQSEAMPRIMELRRDCPSNMVELPTEQNPVTAERTMTGRSMKVLRVE